jgi:hypothetical protein
MVMYDLRLFQNIINMLLGKKIIVPHFINFGPSLTIIMNDGNQCFEEKKLCQKKFIMQCVKF